MTLKDNFSKQHITLPTRNEKYIHMGDWKHQQKITLQFLTKLMQASTKRGNNLKCKYLNTQENLETVILNDSEVKKKKEEK